MVSSVIEDDDGNDEIISKSTDRRYNMDYFFVNSLSVIFPKAGLSGTQLSNILLNFGAQNLTNSNLR